MNVSSGKDLANSLNDAVIEKMKNSFITGSAAVW